MSEAGIKNGGGPSPRLEAMGNGTANSVSTLENKIVCPDCGGPVHYGSRDPCEGDYCWCTACGTGPILFPLGVRELLNRPPNEGRLRGYHGGVFKMAHDILDRQDRAAYSRSE